MFDLKELVVIADLVVNKPADELVEENETEIKEESE